MDNQNALESTNPDVISFLQILYQREDVFLEGTVLGIVHSDRPVEFDQCELNYLTRRYESISRLNDLPRFDSLSPAAEHNCYRGSVSLWKFNQGELSKPVLAAHLRPNGYKPQHVVWHDDRLWVLATECVYVYDRHFQHIATISDPWMAGGHTIVPTGEGMMLTTWSASDSVIIIDVKSMSVRHVLRLPEVLYGRNYPLQREDNVIDHYIHNDLQLTHINAAWPDCEGILVSLLIPGAIGRFNSAGEYQEITRGFVGCHGVRVDHRGQIYYCDSCMGTINFIDREGRLSHRLDCNSRWLHDALEIKSGIFATAVADRNTVEIVDLSTLETITRIDGSELGESVQFLSYHIPDC